MNALENKINRILISHDKAEAVRIIARLLKEEIEELESKLSLASKALNQIAKLDYEHEHKANELSACGAKYLAAYALGMMNDKDFNDH